MNENLSRAVARVAAYDPLLGETVSTALERVLQAADALAWSRDRLPRLVAAGTASGALEVLVDEASELTGAPEVWAVTWTGDPLRGRASFRALAGRSATAGELLEPQGLSRSIVGQVLAEGRPAWSDDARSDARFLASGSVRAFELRSVGCLPLGRRGVLYLHDPETPGRFTGEARARLSALCTFVLPFLEQPAEIRPPARDAVPGLVGGSAAMQDLYAAIRAFAPMPWPALVLGETGTGKEAVARAIHTLSPRATAPFVPVNCGAIPEELAESTLFGHERGAFTGADRRKEGLVERVRGGTLFLDEVGELSPRVQVKLLRLLQEGTYEHVGGDRELRFEGRVVAATHRAIDDADRRGSFREDLFHRLSACVLHVPPLRDRREDIPLLAEHLLDRALSQLPGAPKLILGPDAARSLQLQPWEGNVRELENALRGAIARAMARRSTRIDATDLGGRPPARVDEHSDLLAATDAFQRERVYAAIEACDGNKSRAAEALGVSRQWLHRLLARWDEAPVPT